MRCLAAPQARCHTSCKMVIDDLLEHRVQLLCRQRAELREARMQPLELRGGERIEINPFNGVVCGLSSQRNNTSASLADVTAR